MALLSSLPELPPRMRGLPVDARGYPVPYFVAWLDEHGKTTRPGTGKPDFRCSSPGVVARCHQYALCWICGDRLGSFRSFVIGPMCAVNRVSAEPPSHLECADFAARACPFLVHPKERRRDVNLPEKLPPPGHMILRNPGCVLVWTTRRYSVFSDPHGGALFDIGEPHQVRWYCEGRTATRAEVLHSIDTGLPLLEAAAREDGEPGIAELARRRALVEPLLPAAPA